MRLSYALVFILFAVAAGFLLMPCVSSAQEDAPTEPPAEQKEEQAAPGLSEHIAANTKLNERLAALEKEIAELPDYIETKNSLSRIQSNLDDINWQLEKLIFSKSYSHQKFEFLRDSHSERVEQSTIKSNGFLKEYRRVTPSNSKFENTYLISLRFCSIFELSNKS